MALIFPFITDKFTAYADAKGTITTRLSLAVRVINGVNNQVITDGIKVSLLGETTYKPIQNLSGYYCFTDISRGKYKLIVQSNILNGDQFFSEEVPLDIPFNNELDPVQEVKLIPKPSYLFSINATLIRGMVSRKPVYPATEDDEGEPVVNAKIVAVYKGEQDKIETHTDRNGEFVLLIKKIKFENGSTKKVIKNITIDIVKDNQSLPPIETKEFLKDKPLLEGETGVIIIKDFPAI